MYFGFVCQNPPDPVDRGRGNVPPGGNCTETIGGGGGVGVSGSIVSRKHPDELDRALLHIASLYEFGIRNLDVVITFPPDPEWRTVFRMGGKGGG